MLKVFRNVQYHVGIVFSHGVEERVDRGHGSSVLGGVSGRVLLLLSAEAILFVAEDSLDSASKPLDPAFSPEGAL